MDEVSQKIIDATLSLVRDKGYVATTTKDIAKAAGVNECTLFRKFNTKKDIVLSGMEQEKWRGNVTTDAFLNVQWELKPDLEMFMREYMERITPDFVKLSIGLRAPQIYEETAPMIMKIPSTFLSSLIEYFQNMEIKGKLPHTFGFTFLQSSFENNLSSISKEKYIKQSVEIFIKGIDNQK